MEVVQFPVEAISPLLLLAGICVQFTRILVESKTEKKSDGETRLDRTTELRRISCALDMRHQVAVWWVRIRSCGWEQGTYKAKLHWKARTMECLLRYLHNTVVSDS